MNDSEIRKHQTYTRAQSFGRTHAADFAPDSLAMQLFAKLGAIITKLDAHASRQTSSKGAARQGTDTRAEARDEVRADVRAISQTAHVMDGQCPPLHVRSAFLNVGSHFEFMSTGS